VRPTRPAARDPVDETEHSVDLGRRFPAPADGVLGTDRAAATAYLDRSGVTVAGEGVELMAGGAADDGDEVVLAAAGDRPDGGDPAVAELARRYPPDAPQPLDR
jgi:hypothetical protein